DAVYVSDGVHLGPDDWLRLGKEDGAPISGEFSQNAVFEDVDGAMWFGMQGGAIRYMPPDDLFTRLRQPTPVAITSISWDRQSPLYDPAAAPVGIKGGGHSLDLR